MPKNNMSECDIVRLIFDMVANKGYSTIKLADYLNAIRIPTHYSKDHRGNTANIWRPNNIGRMIKNKTYMGIHIYGKRSKKQRELIERQVPAIIDEDTWNRAQQTLKNNQLDATKNA
ncbi:recombinase family protein [Clostridium aestuarii]|uniref:Recombinase family protein n=1 Tax=Clostridium aestuarii TaxID=338193 RepID=A0ABT4CYB4_9CLOT|nr:recombinase family protein [Clostridium aestuarii]MCY6483960.1 recombinase family protein [Clostridium aestuarii]